MKVNFFKSILKIALLCFILYIPFVTKDLLFIKVENGSSIEYKINEEVIKVCKPSKLISREFISSGNCGSSILFEFKFAYLILMIHFVSIYYWLVLLALFNENKITTNGVEK